jgi:alkylated DNA repair dioxygenase AlkB
MTPLTSIEELKDGGVLRYDPGFLAAADADRYLEYLLRHIPWEARPGPFGHPMPRLTAWFADPGIDYAYSHVLHTGAGWDAVVNEIRGKVEAATGGRFNSVLLNRYRNGQDSVSWHADDEPELGAEPLIASVSLGAPRTFALKHKNGSDRREYLLAHGSLLVMGGTLQRHYRHALPKTSKPVGERVNLTFRWTAGRTASGFL